MKWLLPLLLMLSACSDQTPPSIADAGPPSIDSGPDPSAPLFDPTRLLELSIELDPKDWDLLRKEGRKLPTVMGGCADSSFSYTYFKAAVTVDGKRLADVGLRKKGFLGSLSVVRPSLKLKFNRFVKGQRLLDMERLTLNNNRQDPTNVRQCLSYALFSKAGVRAPRCSYARVKVNGKDLGIYSNVESIKKRFLARRFGDDGGNLYEGQVADFVDGLVKRFEVKQGGGASDLEALTTGLKTEDKGLLAAISPLVDVDAFISYWAAEVLSGHWDSYSGNQNNFLLYNDPLSGRFHFIPWGTDGSFQEEHGLDKSSVPASVYAWGHLARRLYEVPATRDMYRKRLAELLKSTWKEADLLAEVKRVQLMTGQQETGAVATSLKQLRSFIQGRRKALQAELDATAPSWPLAQRKGYACMTKGVSVSGTFSTTWGSLAKPAGSLSSSFNLVFGGKSVSFAPVLAGAGTSTEVNSEGAAILLVGSVNGVAYASRLVIEPSQFVAGSKVAFHGFETFGAVIRLQTQTMYDLLGFIGDGEIVLDKASTTAGEPVTGSYTGRYVSEAM
jgi:CotH kinase protein